MRREYALLSAIAIVVALFLVYELQCSLLATTTPQAPTEESSTEASPGEVTVTSLTQLLEIIKSNDRVAVLFDSTTCPACKLIKPYWDKLAREGRGGIVYVRVTYDPSQPSSRVRDILEVFRFYGVDAVPTLLVFKDGQLVLRKVGLPPSSDAIYTIISDALSR